MRYFMTFSYDGSDFYGYQKQANKRTIQGTIEKVLLQILKQEITIFASGRTDRGVHADNQTAHFDYENTLDLGKLKFSISSLFPEDIYLKNIKIIDDDIHSRYDATYKEYEYLINIGEYSPIDRKYVYQYNKPLNINNMNTAIKYFIGTHDFRSFVNTGSKTNDYTRIVKEASITIENNILKFNFIGTGFMKYQIRNMVGTLVFIGRDKIEPKEILKLLNNPSRTITFPKAPSSGLYLKNVYYEKTL